MPRIINSQAFDSLAFTRGRRRIGSNAKMRKCGNWTHVLPAAEPVLRTTVMKEPCLLLRCLMNTFVIISAFLPQRRKEIMFSPVSVCLSVSPLDYCYHDPDPEIFKSIFYFLLRFLQTGKMIPNRDLNSLIAL